MSINNSSQTAVPLKAFVDVLWQIKMKYYLNQFGISWFIIFQVLVIFFVAKFLACKGAFEMTK